ncbi:MAG: phosphotransferase [Vicinamibacterales bacterium]
MTIPRPRWAARVVPAARHVEALGMVDGRVHVIAAGGTGPSAVVAKRYLPPARGTAAVKAMRAIGRRLDGPDAPLAVPAVLHWDAARGVLLQARAPGQALRARLSTPGRPVALAAAARALAALHACGAAAGRVTGMADHVADLIHPHPRVMAARVPALAARVLAVTDALDHWVPPAGAPAVPIHRDAHPRQMLLDGGRVWLVDWDLAARGDAALDVANFAMYLRTHLASGADAAAERFLDAYAAHHRVTPAGIAAATALTCLRLAVKRWRLARPGWRHHASRLLVRAERALS